MLTFGMGGGLQRDGEWMSGYDTMSAIPMRLIATKSVKPIRVFAEVDAQREAKAARAAAEKAELRWKAAIPRASRSFGGNGLSRLHEEFKSLDRTANVYTEEGRKHKTIMFEGYLKSPHKYHNPLEVDADYFRQAMAVHEPVTKRHDFVYSLSQLDAPVHPALSVGKLRDSAAVLFGSELEKLEGKVVATPAGECKISAPAVLAGQDGLALLAYGLNAQGSGELHSHMLLQDPRDGTLQCEPLESATLGVTPSFTSLEDALSATLTSAPTAAVPEAVNAPQPVSEPETMAPRR